MDRLPRAGAELAYRRAARSLAGTFVVFALLVATHLGEFWPFSIYPMFSSAGNPWIRSLVHEIDHDVSDAEVWRPGGPSDLPGDVLPLQSHGIFQNDLSNFISKTSDWTPERIRGVETMFSHLETDRRFVVYRVRGVLTGQGVDVTAHPLMLISGGHASMTPEVP
jgi:hypothetical protein